MKRLSVVFGVLLLFVCGAHPVLAAAGALQQAIAALPNNADVRIIYTDVLGDKKSVRNDLQISPEQTFHLILREVTASKTKRPPTAATPTSDRWQLVVHAHEWKSQETIEAGSAAEKKLLWLLRRRMATTTDAVEKQNASTLAEALMSRATPFPAPNSGRWVLRSATLTKKP
jgi:hypothetical protein